MDFGRIVVGFMMVIIVAYTLVTCVLLVTPLNQKIQLDQYCRQAMYEANVSGGLDANSRLRVSKKLEEMGLNNIAITCPYPGTLPRRTGGKFNIGGELKVRVVKGFLTTQVEDLHYQFDGVVYEKKVLN